MHNIPNYSRRYKVLRKFIKVAGLSDKEGRVYPADNRFIYKTIPLYSRQGIMHYAHYW